MDSTEQEPIKPTRWPIVLEEGREVIQQWREKRITNEKSRSFFNDLFVCWLNFETIKGFVQNINSMVVVQIAVAILSVHLFMYFDIHFEIPVSLFVSPIVFPLAFSINADFQRREKVLDDLAVFKSHGMVWYFCMREWKQAAELDTLWITAVHGKLKSLLFHLCEYLLTSRPDRRNKILRAMYEDFSDANQLIEKIRASKLPSNSAIISRSVHLLNMMCLSFERLRVIREYRSPRSIRSFNKVFIMLLPIIFAPYFVHISVHSPTKWESYYIAVLVAFVFAALQCVQDKLDDPFDGVGEDNINLNTIDEWTFGSLEHAIKRSFDISRFKKFTTEWLKPPFRNKRKEGDQYQQQQQQQQQTPQRVSDFVRRTSSLTRIQEKNEEETSFERKKMSSASLQSSQIIPNNDGTLFRRSLDSKMDSLGKKINITPKRKDHEAFMRKLPPERTNFPPPVGTRRGSHPVQKGCNSSIACLQNEGPHYHDDNCLLKACHLVMSECIYGDKSNTQSGLTIDDEQLYEDEYISESTIMNNDTREKSFQTIDNINDEQKWFNIDDEELPDDSTNNLNSMRGKECFVKAEYPLFFSRKPENSFLKTYFHKYDTLIGRLKDDEVTPQNKNIYVDEFREFSREDPKSARDRTLFMEARINELSQNIAAKRSSACKKSESTCISIETDSIKTRTKANQSSNSLEKSKDYLDKRLSPAKGKSPEKKTRIPTKHKP